MSVRFLKLKQVNDHWTGSRDTPVDFPFKVLGELVVHWLQCISTKAPTTDADNPPASKKKRSDLSPIIKERLENAGDDVLLWHIAASLLLQRSPLVEFRPIFNGLTSILSAQRRKHIQSSRLEVQLLSLLKNLLESDDLQMAFTNQDIRDVIAIATGYVNNYQGPERDASYRVLKACSLVHDAALLKVSLASLTCV